MRCTWIHFHDCRSVYSNIALKKRFSNEFQSAFFLFNFFYHLVITIIIIFYDFTVYTNTLYAWQSMDIYYIFIFTDWFTFTRSVYEYVAKKKLVIKMDIIEEFSTLWPNFADLIAYICAYAYSSSCATCIR